MGISRHSPDSKFRRITFSVMVGGINALAGSAPRPLSSRTSDWQEDINTDYVRSEELAHCRLLRTSRGRNSEL